MKNKNEESVIKGFGKLNLDVTFLFFFSTGGGVGLIATLNCVQNFSPGLHQNIKLKGIKKVQSERIAVN